MFRRHGITAEHSATRPDEKFWPKQVFKDAFACLVLLGVVLLCCTGGTAGAVPEQCRSGHAGGRAFRPADAAEEYSAARPEWYFLFLFQLLKKFKSEFSGRLCSPASSWRACF